MATPRSQPITTPKSQLNTPRKPNGFSNSNAGTFGLKTSTSTAGKSPAAKTPASLAGHAHRISTSSAPSSTPLAISTLPDELLIMNTPTANALLGMSQTGLTPLPATQDTLGMMGSHAMNGSLTIRDIQAERYNRLLRVTETLSAHVAGRGVTRKSLEILAQVHGFAALWDENLLQIAGDKIIDLEVEFGDAQGARRDVVERTSLKLNLPGEEDGILQESASEVLKRSLTDEQDSRIPWIDLQDFSANLDYLSRFEHIDTQTNCFKAVDNLYDIFQRIWTEEKKRMTWRDEEQHACEGNVGLPEKDANRRLGVRSTYWTSGARSRNSKEHKSSKPNPEHGQWSVDFVVEKGQPAISASQEWLGEQTLTSVATAENLFHDSMIDKPAWQYSSGGTKEDRGFGLGLDVSHSQNHVLDIRFAAALSPILHIPVQVLNALNLTHPLFAIDQRKVSQMQNALKLRHSDVPQLGQRWTKSVHSFDSTLNHKSVTHSYALYTDGPLWVYPVSKIHFSHPRYFAETLPTLRQYALVNALLQSLVREKGHSHITETQSLSIQAPAIEERSRIKKRSNKPALANEMTQVLQPVPPPSLSTNDESLPVDVSLSLSPSASSTTYTPRFEIRIARSASFVVTQFIVRPGGRIEVVEVQGLPKPLADEELERWKKKLAKTIRMSGDLGITVEWILRELK